ncbi:MAG: prepilin-type N-terminal cleavage/methylation domain-containing protein [Planctomycetota bacterium]|nr:prepilin-type N-terminal cleavage/methylation domain-containing protein [Planctomycetota bacterium]
MRSQRGFSLVEILISGALVALAAMAGVAYVTRGTQHASWAKDKVYARQKALSVLAELRAYVEGGEGEVAADLDGFDDGLGVNASLTIQPDPSDPGAYLPPEHPVSSNIQDGSEWRWLRRITVRRFPGVDTRDLRICTVRMFRMREGDVYPGEQMAEVSSVIRTIGDAFPTTQVYDIYLLALENVPGWWVYMDAIQPFIEATLTDLESRNPGLKFRTHWISKSGYGRDEEYAPYTNETRDSRANLPWAYFYPGRMPSGQAAQRYYVAERMQGRVNLDGEMTPQFNNDLLATEPYTDSNSNGERDPGEPYIDVNGNNIWDINNPVPYAIADMHNHCMRYPDAEARFQARIAANLETDDTPTWRLLLDRMVADPDRYHNAILINLHGELLPMPAVRNYSDAAKSPIAHPGWRVVAHPEHLRPARVAGNDASSVAPRFRVYGYKTEFPTGHVPLMTQREPYTDLNRNGVRDGAEPYVDWNNNGSYDDRSIPISMVIPGGDFSQAPNAAAGPSIIIQRLPGGIDADGDSNPDGYSPFANARSYPEAFNDLNTDGIRQIAESYFDKNGNGTRDAGEPHAERDGDGSFSAVTEVLTESKINSIWDLDAPEEPYTDTDGDNQWDAGEPYYDANNNGVRDGPLIPVSPWRAWDPATDNIGPVAEAAYIASYGEPFLDLDGDQAWDGPEPFTDYNQNGVRNGGWERGEMHYKVAYDATGDRTIVRLFGTPLETPYVSNRGVNSTWRLYDLEYVPCPTPSSSGAADRFGRNLNSSGNYPKNTARWTVELPLAAVRTAFESAGGLGDGDAADRIIQVETRIDDDLTTGTMWPTRNLPPNLSRTYAYFYNDANDVPFSERYQFIGDPRHSPYADTDRNGSSHAHGYNWYFDNFNTNGDQRSQWMAFDTGRLRACWRGARGGGHDVPRILSWLRTAVARMEAVYTTLTGFSYYYLSIGGDIGYDSANGFPTSIPVDGKPFGLSGDVYENSITSSIGTSSIRGSLKYVRSNNGSGSGIRAGGYWWSKPWIGELWQDGAYAGQWSQWGNLRANTGSSALEYHQFRRGDVTSNQQPAGTRLRNAYCRLAAEGCTSVFNIGSSSSTFHHQFQSGQTGSLTEDGPQLAANYNFPLPTTTDISRPFGLATSGSGGVGDEFGYTSEYPRFQAQMVRRYYNHNNGQTGSGLVRLQEPGANPRGGFIVVNGIDRTTESGSAFIARYSMLSLIHSFFAAGVPGGDNRIVQLPRLQIQSPTLITELEDPVSIVVRWSTEWKRWDGLNYTESFADTFAEDETNLTYVLMYSTDGGKSWRHMTDNTEATPGEMPWIEGTGPDPAKTVADGNNGGDESWIWSTPAAGFPEGSYLIRIEGYRNTESLHYVQHMEKIYVNR